MPALGGLARLAGQRGESYQDYRRGTVGPSVSYALLVKKRQFGK